MRLAVLIAISVVILGGAVAGYYHFTSWDEHRFDEPIYKAATRHELDPALIKALTRVQGHYPTDGDEPRVGLMRVLESVAERYRLTHPDGPWGDGPWGYICPHREFANHDLDRLEQYRSDKRGTCQAPGCGQPLVPEPTDLAINLDIGCWWLREIEETLKARDRSLSPSELERRALVAYRFGLPRGPFTTTAKQDQFLDEVFRQQARFRPDFDRLARRLASD